MIKKIFISLLLCIVSLQAFAGGIGYINYEKIIDNYKFAQVTKQELNMKAQEMDKFLKQKEEEFNLLESPVQKSKFETQVHEEVTKREEAFNDFVKKREEIVKNKVKNAINQIRTQKELDAILDHENVYSGGTDVTDAVIELLNQ